MNEQASGRPTGRDSHQASGCHCSPSSAQQCGGIPKFHRLRVTFEPIPRRLDLRSVFADLEPLTWLCAFTLGLGVAHVCVYRAWLPLFITLALFGCSIGLRCWSATPVRKGLR